MTDDPITDILNSANIDEADKQQLHRIIENGLTISEQRELARHIEQDPTILHKLNNIIKKKQEFLNDPDKFDEVLEEEEALLEKLNSTEKQ